MKRYWKLVSITTAIVLILGLYYGIIVKSEAKPKFIIETVSGDKDAVKELLMYGDYNEGAAFGDSFELTVDDMTYYSNRSYVKRMIDYNVDKEIKRLQGKYRGFIRGKWLYVNSFNENDELVAYVQITPTDRENHKHKMEVEWLNKATEKKEKFEIEVPNPDNAFHIGVEKVQMVDGKVKVITRLDGNFTEFRMFSLDLENKSIVDDERILRFEEQGENIFYETIVKTDNRIQNPGKYILFLHVVNKHVPVENDYTYMEETVKRELYIYNVENGETEEVELPVQVEESLDFEYYPFNDKISLFNNLIYFSTVTEKGIEVFEYNIETKKSVSKQTFDLNHDERLKEEFSPIILMNEQKIYFANRLKNAKTNSNVYVADLESGDILYEGEIRLDHPEDVKEYELYIHHLEL